MACIRPKIGLCWAWSKTPVMPLCVRRQDQDVKPALRRFRGAAPRGCHTVQRSKAGQPAASLNCCASQRLELSASSSHRGVQLRTLPSSEPTSCSWRECPRASSSEVSHCCSRRCFLAWCLMVSQHPHHVSPLLIDQPGNLWSHGFCLAFFPCLRLSHSGHTDAAPAGTTVVRPLFKVLRCLFPRGACFPTPSIVVVALGFLRAAHLVLRVLFRVSPSQMPLLALASGSSEWS